MLKVSTQHAVTHGVVAKQAFGFEAELAVQADGRFVVGVHRSSTPLQVHPVVGDIQRRRQQFRTDALALPRHRNAHAEIAGMAATDARELLQANVADDRP